MTRLTIPIAAAAVLTAASAAWTPGVRVIDGDTVDAGFLRYRLAGIDTPELRGRGACPETREAAQRAAERLRALIAAAGGDVRLEPVPPYYDLWTGPLGLKRRIARLWVGGRDAGDVLLAEGLAHAYHGGRREPWCQ